MYIPKLNWNKLKIMIIYQFGANKIRNFSIGYDLIHILNVRIRVVLESIILRIKSEAFLCTFDKICIYN